MSVAPLLPVAREDKFFLLFEGLGAPVTALWAMRFAGVDVDRDKLRAATAHALERHPKASSRLVRNPQSLPRKRYREVLAWEPFSSSIDGVCRFHEARPATDGASPKLDPFLEIMNAPMDSGVGPLVEIHWFPHAAGTGTLVFRFHHAFADGHGSLLFLRDLLNHYNGAPAEPAPDYARPPAPLVPGTRMDRLRLFWRLLKFHFRRSWGYRFAPPAKLFDLKKRPGGRIDACVRVFSAEKLARYVSAAKRAGASLNDLLLAAFGRALEPWLRERGLRPGTFRLAINQNLRSRDGSGPFEGNRSSAFPIWIGQSDRDLGPGLVQRIHSQVQECRDQRIAEATSLLGAMLRFSLRTGRKLVLPAATKPRVCDTLIISNMGKAPGLEPDGGWLRLGSGRLEEMIPIGRPPEGIGAISFIVGLETHLTLSLCFLTDLLSRNEVSRLLEILEQHLDELSSEAR